MKYYCNPINVPYHYSFKKDPRDHFRLTYNREAADPSLVNYRGKYYLFASMSAQVWVSEDMISWESHDLPDNMPVYDYAPDACVVGDWLYFTASNRGVPCSFYRTKDPVNGPYEEIRGSFDFWDPDLFADDDGRLYLYWGCGNAEPIWGVELDPETMKPIGEKKGLITGDPYTKGYERFGDDNCENPRTEEEIDVLYQKFLSESGKGVEEIPAENRAVIRATFAGMPYIEGAWMTKHEGKYYLQYACPGSELNVYANAVYVSDHPLGPFKAAPSNPFSLKPGGFIPGAGHGSTMEDREGMFWHTATMRISVNHVFERRVGIWPAGFDREGNLFCCQRYGDWPVNVETVRKDPWADPEWYLLSYHASVTASGSLAGHEPSLVSDENVQTWWTSDRKRPGSFLIMDLGKTMDVHAVQVNFADNSDNAVTCPGDFVKTPDMERYIDTAHRKTRWVLETSPDGAKWEIFEDRRHADTDLPHELAVKEDGMPARYVKLTILEVPYGVRPSISGLRVFGKGSGEKPGRASVKAVRISGVDMKVSAAADGASGYCILWGNDADHLYHSRIVMGTLNDLRIGSLVKGIPVWIRIDAFNENGITHGLVQRAD